MLRIAMYAEVFILLVVSVVLLICAISKNVKKKSNIVAGAYLVMTIGLLFLIDSEIVDFDWNLLILNPAVILVGIILIAGMIVANVRRKNKPEHLEPWIKAVAIIIPVLVFVVPFAIETYLLNACDVYIKYNYQNGWVTSVDTNYAIVKDIPYVVTLNKNIVERNDEHRISNGGWNEYIVTFDGDDQPVIDTSWSDVSYVESVSKIATQVKQTFANIDRMWIYYISDTGNAIISVEYNESNINSDYKDYYYCADKIIEIDAAGNLEEIMYYK